MSTYKKKLEPLGCKEDAAKAHLKPINQKVLLSDFHWFNALKAMALCHLNGATYVLTCSWSFFLRERVVRNDKRLLNWPASRQERGCDVVVPLCHLYEPQDAGDFADQPEGFTCRASICDCAEGGWFTICRFGNHMSARGSGSLPAAVLGHCNQHFTGSPCVGSEGTNVECSVANNVASSEQYYVSVRSWLVAVQDLHLDMCPLMSWPKNLIQIAFAGN